MKRTVLLTLIAFSTIHLFAQTDKGKFIFSIEGNYQKTTTESGTTFNSLSVQSKYTNVGIAAGYFITDRFAVGIGLDYYRNNETRASYLALGQNYQMEVDQIKSTALAPSIHFNYYLPVLPKLYFNGKLKFCYGKIKTDMRSVRASAEPYEPYNLTEYIPNSGSYVSNYNPKFFNARFSPELTWFISSKLGLYLGLGGLEYTISEWDSDNSSFIINFNPSNWRLGVSLKL